MIDEDKQPVAEETETEVQPQTEVASAQTEQPDLDALLKEFDTQAQPQPEKQPDKTPEVDVSSLAREISELKFKLDFEPTLKRIRGDIPKEILGDEELTDLIDGRAKRDPMLQKAWLNRASNPRAWAQVEKALGDQLAKKFTPRVDKNATEDRDAVTAAVRGTSTKAPEEKEPDYGSMNDAQFQAERDKLGV